MTTGGAIAGSDLVMTKWAGLEGTAIIANDYEKELKEMLPMETIEKAAAFSGFLSVLPESRIAVELGALALHDATEGGILGAAWEMADCAGVGLELDINKIPMKEETRMICQAAGIDPYGLISSGTLLIGIEEGEKLVEKLREQGIEAAVIGRFKDGEKLVNRDGAFAPLRQPQSDELYKVKINKVQ